MSHLGNSSPGNPTPELPPAGHPPSPQPPPRSGCLTAFMVIIGIILLLPGLCALIFGGMSLTESHIDSIVMTLVMLGLAIGFGGLMLIIAAIRGARR